MEVRAGPLATQECAATRLQRWRSDALERESPARRALLAGRCGPDGTRIARMADRHRRSGRAPASLLSCTPDHAELKYPAASNYRWLSAEHSALSNPRELLVFRNSNREPVIVVDLQHHTDVGTAIADYCRSRWSVVGQRKTTYAKLSPLVLESAAGEEILRIWATWQVASRSPCKTHLGRQDRRTPLPLR
jgi:hypothetical protein